MSTEDTLALAAAPLSAQERQFVEHLVADPEFSLAAAARAVGYLDQPDKAAARLLKRQAVTRYLAALQADSRDRLREVRDQVIQTLWQLAAGWDVAALVGEVEETDEQGNTKTVTRALSPDKLPAGLRAAVKEVKRDRFGGWEYKFVDRGQILGLLLKHFGEADRYQGRNPSDDAPEAPKVIVHYPE